MGKTKSKKDNNSKKIMRSCLTGRITNGRDIILVTEAEDYLKMKGYHIIELKEEKNKFIIKVK